MIFLATSELTEMLVDFSNKEFTSQKQITAILTIEADN
jgi:hypothetical protein